MHQVVHTIIPPGAIPPLSVLGLSLSSACGADCIYCPADRGARIRQKNMPLEIAKKAIDDASVVNDRVQVKSIHFGENGDAFINKNAIEVIMYAKEKIPSAQRSVTTNVQTLTEDKIEQIMADDLLDHIGLNIDGISDKTFFVAKEISSAHALSKLPMLINARKKYNRKTTIHVTSLSAKRYAEATLKVLGVLPSKLKEKDKWILSEDDDFEEVKKFVTPLLSNGDAFGASHPFFWAERAQVDKTKINYKSYSCPLFGRLIAEALIAPDGTWYGCCFDSNNQIDFGNICEASLADLSRGESRRLFIERLYNKQFAEIGAPCDTVNCCTPIHAGELTAKVIAIPADDQPASPVGDHAGPQTAADPEGQVA